MFDLKYESEHRASVSCVVQKCGMFIMLLTLRDGAVNTLTTYWRLVGNVTKNFMGSGA